jgi:hypothetical protein
MRAWLSVLLKRSRWDGGTFCFVGRLAAPFKVTVLVSWGAECAQEVDRGIGGHAGSVAFISAIVGHWGFSPLAHLGWADS